MSLNYFVWKVVPKFWSPCFILMNSIKHQALIILSSHCASHWFLLLHPYKSGLVFIIACMQDLFTQPLHHSLCLQPTSQCLKPFMVEHYFLQQLHSFSLPRQTRLLTSSHLQSVTFCLQPTTGIPAFLAFTPLSSSLIMD